MTLELFIFKSFDNLIKIAAMVTALDDAVGKIVTSLKKNKMYKNTFIMFTADVSSYFSINIRLLF